MNRDQKAVAIAEIAEHIRESEAVFAVDYQGISVPQAAELRAKLRESDATFQIVKNSLTERAADEAQAQELKALLQGPTALTFVRGDAASAAKALADYARATQLLPFKGGLMDGAAVDPEQIRAISRLPSREVLYGQLVGVVASPVSGLVRTLGALVGGLAVALGQVQAKKESGGIPAGEAPAAEVSAAETPAEADAEPAADDASETGNDASQAESAADPESQTAAEPDPPSTAAAETEVEETEVEATDTQAEPAEPANNDNQDQADASAEETQPEDAEATTPKED
jgi:large subunit ribosomal protein L10